MRQGQIPAVFLALLITSLGSPSAAQVAPPAGRAERVESRGDAHSEELRKLRAEIERQTEILQRLLGTCEAILEELQRVNSVPAQPAERRAPRRPGEAVMIDDFEGPIRWRSEAWGDPAKIKRVEGETGNAVQVRFTPGKHRKSVIARSVSLDLSGAHRFALDVSNSSPTIVRVSIAMFTGEDRQYFESRPVSVPASSRRLVSFSLKGEDFKCAATHWAHKAQPADADKIKVLAIIFSAKGEATVQIDNVRAETPRGFPYRPDVPRNALPPAAH